jgi:hypothetical protein
VFLWCHHYATTHLILSILELCEYFFSFLCSVIVISGGWNQPHGGSKKQVNMLLSLDNVQLFQDIIYCVFVIDFCWRFQYIRFGRSVNCFVIKISVCVSALKQCVKSGFAYGLFRELLN